MSICFDEEKKIFLLNTPSSTYIIRIVNGYLLHGGWVKNIRAWSGLCVLPVMDRAYAPVPCELHGKSDFSLDAQANEFPFASRTDFRSPAIEALCADGTIASHFVYEAHRIYDGKKALTGLPATYTNNDGDASSLEIDLYDSLTGIRVTLFYTVWNDYDVICRHTEILNTGNAEGIYKGKSISLQKIMSASIDFSSSRYKMLQLSGAHARERHIIERNLVPGVQSIESKRCMSSHQQNPFIALVSNEATEENGEVFGFNLVYSGNFIAQVEVDQFNMSRVQVGINPYNFNWNLEVGSSFCTPEVVMVRSDNGLGGMSRIYHDLYRSNLCRGNWKEKVRPIVINNWEATYFNFNADKLFALADTASKEGIELFVLDDGWFGHRDSDTSSLGDWIVDKNKLPGGLEEIADGIHKRGMKFGLWFEPEMVSPDSDLFRAHPDWALHIDGRPCSLGRHQLVLDMSRSDVVDYLIEAISKVLSSVNIDYVKWDFNRSPTEVASSLALALEQQKTSHRYYLGLYRLLETLVTKFPDVLFESCAGGGGRFDPAMLYYMPQTWTSDNTDSLSRLQIQFGTSIVYPPSAMSCHVSAVPNHQVGRISTLSQRAHVAMAGTYGYELDLNKLSEPELLEIKEQVAFYKSIRDTVQFGDLYRLDYPCVHKSVAEVTDVYAWELLSKDKRQAVVSVVWNYAEANAEANLIRLRGLEENASYKVRNSTCLTVKFMVRAINPDIPDADFNAIPEGAVISGEELMNIGLFIVSKPQYGGSVQFVLEKV